MNQSALPPQLELLPPRESRFDKTIRVLTLVSSVLGAVFIPWAIASAANSINSTLQAKAIDAEYVELALHVVAEPVPEDHISQDGDPDHVSVERNIVRDRHLRRWAVDVMIESSPVPITEEAAEDLRQGAQTLPRRPGTVDESGELEFADSGPDVSIGPAAPTTSPPSTSASSSGEVSSDSDPEIVSISDWLGADRAVVLAALRDQGFEVKAIVVCSGSVAAGEVRQVLAPDESVVYVDLGGTTNAGSAVAAGSRLLVKVGSGQPC